MNNEGIDYRMTKKMFDNLLESRVTEDDKKMNPYVYVMNVVNESFGLKGTVKHISIFDI